MRAYLIRRLLLIFPTLFILSIVVFLSVRFIPGDVIDVMVAQMGGWWAVGGDIDREALERRLGLDVPVYVQYGRWIGVLPTPDWITGESHFRGLLQGTLGEPLIGGFSTIDEMIMSRLPVTIELGIMAIVIGLVIALPVGIYSAIRQDTATDYLGRTVAVIGLATPNFWLGVMVMLYPAIWWGWSPSMEYIPLGEDPLGNLGMLIIPAVILGTGMSAATMRMTRTMMLEELRQDYVRTAWSKGIEERVIVIRHVIKNSFIPILTLIGLQFPLLIGGAVIMENIFNLPGIGRLFMDALEGRDYPVVSGINLVFATIVMLSIVLIDMIYPYLDPRIRYK